MNLTKELLDKLLKDADAIVIGAGSGLSAAAGFEYGGQNFLDNFPEMYEKYGYTDMYSAGFHDFDTPEEKWAFWSKYVYLNRYKDGAKDLYKRLFNLVKDKNYFVITTNVDHQFQLAGFDKQRLYYMQGDYGLFQCSKPCRKETFDNKQQILDMRNSIVDNKISSNLIPRCPYCGRPMVMNLREDDRFVQDDGWYCARNRYEQFINENKHKKVVYLELGVGYSTPVWIKYPFMRLTFENKNANYICVDNGMIRIPKEIEKQSYIFNKDINQLI